MRSKDEIYTMERMNKYVKEDMKLLRANIENIICTLINDINCPLIENFDEWWKEDGVYDLQNTLKQVHANIGSLYAHAKLIAQVHSLLTGVESNGHDTKETNQES